MGDMCKTFDVDNFLVQENGIVRDRDTGLFLFRLADAARFTWQPIETAPKDGTLILIGNPESEDMPATTTAGRWFEAYEDSLDEMGCDAGFCDVDFSLFHAGRSFGELSSRYEGLQPSHWMPLPEPPAGS